MKCHKLSMLFFLTGLFFFSCAGGNQVIEQSPLDKLIVDIAERTAILLPQVSSSNIAVYYFTSEGNEVPYSDYLINGLTTEIANRAPEGTNMVSRNGLDRVMEEYSFQLTDLVSEETQVDIGELLGADTIITGYITELENHNNVNVQLIDVHTGKVIGGFTLNYDKDATLSSEGQNERVTMEREFTKTAGIATTTIIYEDFNGPIVEISPAYFDEHWGERIINLDGETGVDPQGFAYLDFSGTVDSIDYLNGWDSTDMTFYLDLPLNAEPGDSEGVYVKIQALDFSRAYLFLRQMEGDDQVIVGSPITLIPGEWFDLRIPFSSLLSIEGEKRLDKNRPVSVSIGIPYWENVEQGHLRSIDFKGRVSIDELGLYSLKNGDPIPTIESFEDEILRTNPNIFFQGTHTYVDYSENDEGILRINNGIDLQNITYEILEEGPVGRYFSATATLSINPQIEDFLDDFMDLVIITDFRFAKRPSDEETLSFLVKAEGLDTAFLYGSDPKESYAFESSIRAGSNWSRVSIPFRELLYDDDSGMDRQDPYLLRMIWAIPQKDLRQSATQDSELTVKIQLDEFQWE